VGDQGSHAHDGELPKGRLIVKAKPPLGEHHATIGSLSLHPELGEHALSRQLGRLKLI